MLLIQLIVGSALIFIAGSYWTYWKLNKRRSDLYWSIGLVLFGLYNMISMIGRASLL